MPYQPRRIDNLTHQWPGWLHILEPQAIQILQRRKPFDALSVLIHARIVPEPVLTAIGKYYKGSIEVLCVAPRLFPGIIRVSIFTFRLQNTQWSSKPAKDVIRPAICTVKFKTDLFPIEQVPAAEFQRLVDEDTRESFVLAGVH